MYSFTDKTNPSLAESFSKIIEPNTAGILATEEDDAVHNIATSATYPIVFQVYSVY